MIDLTPTAHITLTPAQWQMVDRTGACPKGHKISIPGLDAVKCDRCQTWYGVMIQKLETKRRVNAKVQTS